MEPATSSAAIAALCTQAAILHRQGNTGEALAMYRLALHRDANNFSALLGLGGLNAQLGRHEEALENCDQALLVDPGNADVCNLRGRILKELARYQEALESCERAIAIRPDFAEAYCNRGNALGTLRRYADALASYERAIYFKSDYAEAYYKRGLALQQLKSHEQALASYDRAIALKADYAESYNDRGIALQCLTRHEEALASYDRAIALKPDYAEAYNNRGIALRDLRRYAEALANYDWAIALKPDIAESYSSRGIALQDLKQYAEALANYDRAISVKSDYLDAYNNRGVVLRDMERYAEALVNYDRAIALNPAYANAYYNRGMVLEIMHRHEDALPCFNKAISLDHNCPHAQGYRLAAEMHIALWDNFDRHVQELIALIEQGVLASEPFPLLAIPATSGTLQKCASHHVTDKYPSASPSTRQGKHYSHDRIRVGYFSADFRDHPIAYLTAELFEKHDRSRFEIYAFSFGPESDGGMRARLRKAFDKFFTLSQETDQEIAALAKSMEIDIAIDLMGFTKHARLALFALHLAPIQVSYLGYPGTLGAPFMDYLIGDPTVIPVEDFAYYSEKIVQLPYCYQVNDTRRRIADTAPGRSQSGLPETGFVFCCFNNNFKITPDVFDIWMRLLAKIDDSVLWLLEANPAARRNLSREARSRGIEPARLVFAPRMSQPEHLARHRHADLFLDTFYYNAHTTASDALWTGLPVLTCHGNTFAGRVAASLLRAAGLPELITYTHEEYESMALMLATNPDILAAAKRKLEQNRAVCPLFNTDLFTRHIEEAYATMWRRHRQGLPPDHIYMPE